MQQERENVTIKFYKVSVFMCERKNKSKFVAQVFTQTPQEKAFQNTQLVWKLS